MTEGHVPLVIIACASSSALVERVASQLRLEGNVVYVTHGVDGCLRVATSVHADMVLLDPQLPHRGRLEKLLKAHPLSASAQILHLSENRQANFRLRRAPVTADPHAA